MENANPLTPNERELIEIIRAAKDYGKAFEIAVTMIVAFIQDAERERARKCG